MKKNITLKGLSYTQLRNLINYFERNVTFVTYTYEVKAKRKSAISEDVLFEITFPSGYVKSLPMEQAIQMVLDGKSYEV